MSARNLKNYFLTPSYEVSVILTVKTDQDREKKSKTVGKHL